MSSLAHSTPITVHAPAKLNLFLHVVGRLENGYHQLQSLFTRINLCDTLTFTLRSDGIITRQNKIDGIAEQDDLVIRAARLLRAHTHCSQGVDIQLKKCIPSGAGLGGGSSDAATTLMVLNQYWNTGLSSEELQELGVQLGADVPFFIFGKTAIVTGIGEQLKAFELAPLFYVIVRPDLSIPTPLIFKDVDLVRNSPLLNESELDNGRKLMERGQHFARNDLEAVALKLFPQLHQLIKGIKQHTDVDLRMTGSGSCFFAPYLSYEEAYHAKAKIEQWLQISQPELAVEHIFIVHTV